MKPAPPVTKQCMAASIVRRAGALPESYAGARFACPAPMHPNRSSTLQSNLDTLTATMPWLARPESANRVHVDWSTAPPAVALVEVDQAHEVAGQRLKCRIGVVGLVEENRVGIEVVEHRFEAGPHDAGSVEVVHVAGDQLLIGRSEDLEVLAQRKQVVVARHPEPGNKTNPQHRHEDDADEETLGFHSVRCES